MSMEVINLKFGAYMDSRLMYCVPESGPWAITFEVAALDQFYNLP